MTFVAKFVTTLWVCVEINLDLNLTNKLFFSMKANVFFFQNNVLQKLWNVFSFIHKHTLCFIFSVSDSYHVSFEMILANHISTKFVLMFMSVLPSRNYHNRHLLSFHLKVRVEIRSAVLILLVSTVFYYFRILVSLQCILSPVNGKFSVAVCSKYPSRNRPVKKFSFSMAYPDWHAFQNTYPM